MITEADKATLRDATSINALKKAVDVLDLVNAAPYLVLGWTAKKELKAGTYPINDDMAEELRSVASTAINSIATREMSVYAGPTQLHREQGMWVPASRINAAAPLFAMLREPDALEDVKPVQLTKKSLTLFAIGVGSAPDDRFFFVTKSARNIRGDTAILGILRGPMRPITSNIVILQKRVDFILHDTGAIVFNSAAFERFLQDPADTDAQLDEHLASMSTGLPVDAATLESLRENGRQGLMLRMRIRSIVTSDHFKNITIPKLTEELTKLKHTPGDYIKDGKLSFSPEKAPFLLRVLDDRAWVGPFSGKVFSSEAAISES